MNIDKENTFKMTGNVLVERINSLGEVVESREIKNLVVDTGKYFIASRMVGEAKSVMSYMALGSSTTTPAGANTTLGTEFTSARVSVTGSNTSGTNTVTYTATFPAGTVTGAVTEAGIFNANSGGDMLCRTTFLVVNKAAGDSIAVTWVVTVN